MLADAIRATARGETVLAPRVAQRLVTHVRQPPPESLSPRETGVLSLAARGLTNAEIGRELFISEATVKTHLLRAFAKLGVSSRTAAVTRALQAGLLPIHRRYRRYRRRAGNGKPGGCPTRLIAG